MLPQKVLSTQADTAAFLPPRNRNKELLVDYERGGRAIQDASDGLDVYDWRGRYVGTDFILDVPPGIVAPTTLFSVADVTEFQFTFDQNMQPFVTYRLDNGEAYYRWFDSTIPDFRTDQLPAGARSPRCALDDKRALAGTQAGASDIILAYIRDDALKFRAQADRYDTEYALAAGDLADYGLGQIGMNRVWRFQFQLVARADT